MKFRTMRYKILRTDNLFYTLGKLHERYLESTGSPIREGKQINKLTEYFTPEFIKQQELSRSDVSFIRRNGLAGLDAFGSPIRIEVAGESYLLWFVSDGPDGKPNTSDDIRKAFSWIPESEALERLAEKRKKEEGEGDKGKNHKP